MSSDIFGRELPKPEGLDPMTDKILHAAVAALGRQPGLQRHQWK